MENFVFLDDEATADIAFIAYGKTKSEMIANACRAVTTVMIELNQVSEIITFKKHFDAEDLLGLVYDVLNYLLFLFDTEDLLFAKFDIILDLEKPKLDLFAQGEKYNPRKHEIKTHIKAVTFFGMQFDEEGLKVTLDL